MMFACDLGELPWVRNFCVEQVAVGWGEILMLWQGPITMDSPLLEESMWDRCPPGAVAEASQLLQRRLRLERLQVGLQKGIIGLALVVFVSVGVVRWTPLLGVILPPVSCETARQWLPMYVHHTLGLISAARVQHHLTCCDNCAQAANLLQMHAAKHAVTSSVN